MFISDLQVVDVGIDYNHYTRPSDPNGKTVITHFRDLPPFTASQSASPLSSLGYISGSNDGDRETVCPSSFVRSRKLEPLKHQNAVAAYAHILCGVLASAAIDRIDNQDDRIFIPDAGHTHGQIKGRERPKLPYSEEQQLLEASKKSLFCSATAIPRFLFRGFHSMSGGGLDPRLNSKNGVVPHAFLDGEEPADMWGVPNLQNEISKHLGQSRKMRSHFSSWSPKLHIALLFATWINVRNPKSPMIAVLDTGSVLGRVWHTHDLEVSGLARQSYTSEYHVYGPVSGPKYRCVPVQKLFRIPDFRAIMTTPVPRPLGHVVQVSWKIAKVLGPPNATLDTILILTAKSVGYHCERTKHPQTPSSTLLRGFLYHVRDTLQALAMRSDARYISLAVPNVSTDFSSALDLELQMLLAAENAVHILGWTWEGAKSRIYDPYRRRLENEYWKRECEKSRRKRDCEKSGKRRGLTVEDPRPLKRQRLS